MQRYAVPFARCFITCKTSQLTQVQEGEEDLQFVGAGQGDGCASKTVPKSLIICHRVAGALDCFSNNGVAAAAEFVRIITYSYNLPIRRHF